MRKTFLTDSSSSGDYSDSYQSVTLSSREIKPPLDDDPLQIDIQGRVKLISEEKDKEKKIQKLESLTRELKHKLNKLEECLESKEITVVKARRIKEKALEEVQRVERRNKHLQRQLDEERSYYLEQKERFCAEMSKLKNRVKELLEKNKWKGTPSNSKLQSGDQDQKTPLLLGFEESNDVLQENNVKRNRVNFTLEVEALRAENTKLRDIICEKDELNYELCVRFLRMKTSKNEIKTKFMGLEKDYLETLTNLMEKIDEARQEFNFIIDKQFQKPIHTTNAAFLQLIQKNSRLVYENSSLRFQIQTLRRSTQSDNSSRLESNRSSSTSTAVKKRARHKKVPPNSDGVGNGETGRETAKDITKSVENTEPISSTNDKKLKMNFEMFQNETKSKVPASDVHRCQTASSLVTPSIQDPCLVLPITVHPPVEPQAKPEPKFIDLNEVSTQMSRSVNFMNNDDACFLEQKLEPPDLSKCIKITKIEKPPILTSPRKSVRKSALAQTDSPTTVRAFFADTEKPVLKPILKKESIRPTEIMSPIVTVSGQKPESNNLELMIQEPQKTEATFVKKRVNAIEKHEENTYSEETATISTTETAKIRRRSPQKKNVSEKACNTTPNKIITESKSFNTKENNAVKRDAILSVNEFESGDVQELLKEVTTSSTTGNNLEETINPLTIEWSQSSKNEFLDPINEFLEESLDSTSLTGQNFDLVDLCLTHRVDHASSLRDAKSNLTLSTEQDDWSEFQSSIDTGTRNLTSSGCSSGLPEMSSVPRTRSSPGVIESNSFKEYKYCYVQDFGTNT